MIARGGRTTAAGLAVLAALVTTACGGRKVQDAPTGQAMGIYTVRLERPDSRTRKFKLWLYAERPDRLHGEIVTPIGTTALILDGGDGQLAVSFVRDRLAFVGPAEPEALERLLGVSIELEQLVGALLGEPVQAEGVQIQREARAPGQLPERLAISGSGKLLEMKLRRLRPLREGVALGTGAPPEGMELRELEALRLEEIEARIPEQETSG